MECQIADEVTAVTVKVAYIYILVLSFRYSVDNVMYKYLLLCQETSFSRSAIVSDVYTCTSVLAFVPVEKNGFIET